MNANLICRNIAGPSGSCRGVVFDDVGIHIKEIRFSYMAHLLFICGKPIARFLEGAVLSCEDGSSAELRGIPQLSITCPMWAVPYRLTDILFAAKEKEEKA